MHLIDNIKRFGKSGLLFILGLTIASFVILTTSDVFTRVANEDNSFKHFEYSALYRIGCIDDKSDDTDYASLTEALISSLKELDCTVRFSGINVPIEQQIDTYNANIIISSDQGTGLTDKEGQAVAAAFPSQSNSAVIGKSLVDFSVDRKGERLKIFNSQATIATVLANNSPSNIDYSLCIFLDSCDDSLKSELIDSIAVDLECGYLEVYLESSVPLDDTLNKFRQDLASLSLKCDTYEKEYYGNDYQNYWYREFNVYFIGICILFSLYTCFCVSYFWLSSRKMEISIRKAYGYNNFQLFRLLLADTLKLTVPSILISLIIQCVYCAIFGLTDYFDKLFILKLLAVTAVMFIVSLLCVLNLMSSVAKISPAYAVRSEL